MKENIFMFVAIVIAFCIVIGIFRISHMYVTNTRNPVRMEIKIDDARLSNRVVKDIYRRLKKRQPCIKCHIGDIKNG